MAPFIDIFMALHASGNDRKFPAFSSQNTLQNTGMGWRVRVGERGVI